MFQVGLQQHRPPTEHRGVDFAEERGWEIDIHSSNICA